MLKIIKNMLESGKTIVIDKFQRCDESMIEEFIPLHPKGKLILSGSNENYKKDIWAHVTFAGIFILWIGFINHIQM